MFFKKTTVSSIMTSFHKQIAQLDAVAEREATRADTLSRQIDTLCDQRAQAMTERVKANTLATRLSQFVDPDA